MELLPTDQFLACAAARGVGYDERYPRSGDLAFVAAPDHWTAWPPPASVGELAWFVHLVLETAAGASGDLLVFPRHSGHWYTGGTRAGGRAAPWVNDALDVVVRGAGITEHFAGAARFAAAERSTAAALAVASLVFGWGTTEDLFLLPAEGGCVLMTDHHGQIVGKFPSGAAREAFHARLAAAGYVDPDDEEEPAHPEPAA